MVQPYDPVATVFLGTIVHSTGPSDIEILSPGLCGVGASGKILFCKSLSREAVVGDAPAGTRDELLAGALKEYQAEDATLRILSAHTLLIPGLIDTHVHAPQYIFTGTGYTLPLLAWLAKFTFPQEKRFASVEHAELIYPRAVSRSLRCGTTTAAWYGTLHVPGTKVLAQTCARLGQRAFVGKVCMDRHGGDGYVEDGTEESLQTTREFIDAFDGMEGCGTDSAKDLVTPIITPRFAVSCTPELLKGLGELAKERSLPIQTHCSENKGEIAFVKELFPTSESYVNVYKDHGLLTSRTVLAHCVHLSDDERSLLHETGAGVSHCPVSNYALDSGCCDVRALLDADCKVGLGTDVAGGWSMSVVEAMRTAILASRSIGFGKRETTDEYRPLSLAEVFHLATLGGADILGIAETTGSFVVGKDFDALVVDLDAGDQIDARSSKDDDNVLGMRPVEVFDHDTPLEMFEKFVFLSDDRNIAEVYVAGRKVV
ncbi:hypothetical protein HKX48_008742 [Thoreauomyces humboldtii]|nr:hypothetical protein HKX48_008742 [Thoreauomyces humboldtii]